MQLSRPGVAVLVAAAVAAWAGGALASAVLGVPETPPAPPPTVHGQPITENWEDRYFPFVGFEPEVASAEAVRASGPTAKPEHPDDDMVTIPAGPFARGDRTIPTADKEETISLPAFAIDRYEVTNRRYAAFVAATGRRAPFVHEHWASVYNWRDGAPQPGREGLPVVLVSWRDARDFCAWSGRRLPTEAEWEKAARGTDARRYPWGDTWDSRKANVASRLIGPLRTEADWDRFEDTEWTGSKKPEIFAPGSYPDDVSPFGLYDMQGNVSEWVAGVWPDEQQPLRIARGNSWGNRDYSTPLAVRYPYEEQRVDSVIGFRCAKDL